MFAAYLIVTGLAAAANIFSAICDFVRYKQVSIAMAKAGVSESWMTLLGVLKAAGATGLLVGIGLDIKLEVACRWKFFGNFWAVHDSHLSTTTL